MKAIETRNNASGLKSALMPYGGGRTSRRSVVSIMKLLKGVKKIDGMDSEWITDSHDILNCRMTVQTMDEMERRWPAVHPQMVLIPSHVARGLRPSHQTEPVSILLAPWPPTVVYD